MQCTGDVPEVDGSSTGWPGQREVYHVPGRHIGDGRTFQEHLDNLTQVLTRLREAGLRLNPQKCHLVKREVCYLGYVVSVEGISADPSKVAAVRNFVIPADLKSLRSFLGLASYYWKFIPAFSKVAAPLFALTHMDIPFEKSERCQQSFDDLKALLTQAQLLAFPDFSKSFVLDTDASGQDWVQCYVSSRRVDW